VDGTNTGLDGANTGLDRIERLGLRPVVKPDDAEIDYTAVGWCVAKRHPRAQATI